MKHPTGFLETVITVDPDA